MLCIIPARGGSKRIPGKNIKPFLGVPIIEYSIRAALDAGCFDEVMVSTDSEEIAAVARAAGASVPWLRSAKNSDDMATTADVVREVLDCYEAEGRTFDSFAVLYAAAPFISVDTLLQGRNLLAKGFRAAFTCIAYSYPVQRSLVIENDRVHMAHPEFMSSLSQDLPVHYHDAGQCYFSTVKAFNEAGSLWGPDTAPIILEDLQVQAIDTPVDWKLAELKYRLLHYPEPEEQQIDREDSDNVFAAVPRHIGLYLLVPYQDLDAKTSERIRVGRNLPEIRRRMVNTDPIAAPQHEAFVRALANVDDQAYFALYCRWIEEQEPELVGSITLTAIDSDSLERGIWLFPESQGCGIARSVLSMLYDALASIGFKRVYTRVRPDNDSSLSLEEYLGAKEVKAIPAPGAADPGYRYFVTDIS